MKTIETTITVLPDGSIQVPPRSNRTVGQHKAVLVVEEQIVPARFTERELATAALRAAGLLAEPTAEMLQLAATSTLTLE